MIGMKALLIVSAIAGGGDYTTEMPNMKSCLDARIAIEKQAKDIKTLCVPTQDETKKVEAFFTIFMNMIAQLKEYEEVEKLNRNDISEENCKREFGSLFCKE